MSLFHDLKLKRRKTSSVLVETNKSTSNYIQTTNSPSNSSNNSNSPTLLNQLLLQRAKSPNFETTKQLNTQTNNNLIFATGSNVIVANKQAVEQTAKKTNGQTCTVIQCGNKNATINKLSNKSVIQQYRSNSFSSSNSSLSPPSSSPPTPLLVTWTNSNQNFNHQQPTKLVNTNNNGCFNGLLQHSQSINSSGNSSPPSASSSCSPPSTSSAVSIFEIDSDQCLDLTSSTNSSALTTVSLTNCSSTLTTVNTLNNNHLNKQTVTKSPFIAHQTIIKLQPTSQNDLTNSRCPSSTSLKLEHQNYQLPQTAKGTVSCPTATSEHRLFAIDTNNSNLKELNSIKNSPNSNQNLIKPAKSQTFMLASEHIPNTFNQHTQHHSINTLTTSSNVVSNCATKTTSNNNNSGKTMLWTLVNSGSIVNANILFATIPNTSLNSASNTSTVKGTNINFNKPDNKLSNNLVQCVKPTALVDKSVVKALSSTPVLKYTTFVSPNSNLNATSTLEEQDTKVINAPSCITSSQNVRSFFLMSM